MKETVLVGSHSDIELFKNGLPKPNKNAYCVNLVYQGAKGRCPYVVSRWPATSWVHYTTSCNTQSSVPEDGKIIAETC